MIESTIMTFIRYVVLSPMMGNIYMEVNTALYECFLTVFDNDKFLAILQFYPMSILFQVETIGDAYMVASGIPKVNEHHASEIAKMALDLHEKVIESLVTKYENIFFTINEFGKLIPFKKGELPACCILLQIATFEVAHKPGYQISLRKGIHSGGCVAGVVGTKIPHYSVFGETVEIAGLMEATSEPMKIQV